MCVFKCVHLWEIWPKNREVHLLSSSPLYFSDLLPIETAGPHLPHKEESLSLLTINICLWRDHFFVQSQCSTSMGDIGQPTFLFSWIHIPLACKVRKMSSEDIFLPNMLGKMGIWINLPSSTWVRQPRMVSEKTNWHR